jgi:hypothetical protein
MGGSTATPAELHRHEQHLSVAPQQLCRALRLVRQQAADLSHEQ